MKIEQDHIVVLSLTADEREHHYLQFNHLGVLAAALDLAEEKYLNKRTVESEDASYYTITDKGKRYFDSILRAAKKIHNHRPK